MTDRGILLVGLGGFGRNHLKAWHEIGLLGRLYVAEKNPAQRAVLQGYDIPASRIVADARDVLDSVGVVDIVTPSTTHYALCREALSAGKDVFVEKPMTMTSAEAEELTTLVRQTDRVLQVGYYYRFHPISVLTRELIGSNGLGTVRYISGQFLGFKRARTDVGVTHTDGVHFIDLFNWWLRELPCRVSAWTRDHFNRGMDDFSVVMLEYPGGALVKVESGYIQPGRWRDKVVPHAWTTKTAVVCGERATLEADFETEQFIMHRVRHQFNGTTWAPSYDRTDAPGTGTMSPVQMVAEELRAFLDAVERRARPDVDVFHAGLAMARIIEATYESSQLRQPVDLDWTPYTAF